MDMDIVDQMKQVMELFDPIFKQQREDRFREVQALERIAEGVEKIVLWTEQNWNMGGR